MLQTNWVTAADLSLFTDASGTLGYSAYFQGTWIIDTWSKQQLANSIQWKELTAIAATWGHKWQRQKIIVYCDNLAIVQVWQAQKKKKKKIKR